MVAIQCDGEGFLGRLKEPINLSRAEFAILPSGQIAEANIAGANAVEREDLIRLLNRDHAADLALETLGEDKAVGEVLLRRCRCRLNVERWWLEEG